MQNELAGEATGNANNIVGIMVIFVVLVLLLTSTAVVGKIVGFNPTEDES